MKQITMDFKEYQEELVQSHEDGYSECYKNASEIIRELMSYINDGSIPAFRNAMEWVDDE